MFELIFVGLITAACFLLLDRKDKRNDESLRAAQLEHDRAVTELIRRGQGIEAAHRTELIAVFAAHRDEVQILLQRIQAPEYAVVEHQQAKADDESPYPLTDEESAEAQDERARMIATLERMENEGILA